MNLRMPDLKECLEAAGFEDVRTLLSSGNAVFGARERSEAAIQKKAEAAMQKHLGRTFMTLVRSVDTLQEMLDSDPYEAFRVPAGAKRVVTFLPDAPGKIALPDELHGARILCVRGREAFSVYTRGPQGPVFMKLIEQTFGDEVTTRTWDTVRKAAGA